MIELSGHAVGRVGRRPAKLHGDKGYDYPTCQRTLRRRGITARIARRGLESTHPAAERGVAVEGSRRCGLQAAGRRP
jgi:IS5 family transposase